MRWMAAALLAAVAGTGGAAAQSAPAASPQVTAEAIMAEVALHQDQAEAERTHYVYVQHAKTVSRRGSTVMCEEFTDYRVTPAAAGSHQELLKVQGRVKGKRGYADYTTLLPEDEDGAKAQAGGQADGKKPDSGEGPGSVADPSHAGQPAASGSAAAAPKPADPKADDDDLSISIGGGVSVDRQIVEHMRKNLMNDPSRDGINARLFPLTSKGQADYTSRCARFSGPIFRDWDSRWRTRRRVTASGSRSHFLRNSRSKSCSFSGARF